MLWRGFECKIDGGIGEFVVRLPVLVPIDARWLVVATDSPCPPTAQFCLRARVTASDGDLNAFAYGIPKPVQGDAAIATASGMLKQCAKCVPLYHSNCKCDVQVFTLSAPVSGRNFEITGKLEPVAAKDGCQGLTVRGKAFLYFNGELPAGFKCADIPPCPEPSGAAAA